MRVRLSLYDNLNTAHNALVERVAKFNRLPWWKRMFGKIKRRKQMTQYAIYAGLGGGFGGARYQSTEECATQEAAEDIAFEMACETYESYVGLHGLRDISDIMDEEECDEDEANEIFRDERGCWLDYYAEVATGDEE